MHINILIPLFVTLMISGEQVTPCYWNDLSLEEQNKVLSDKTVSPEAVNYYKGFWEISDEGSSFSLLDTLSSSYSDNRIKAFYFYIFNQILLKSDGALGEVMGVYCGRVLLGDPYYVLGYLKCNPVLYQKYVFEIGAEFALSTNGNLFPDGVSYLEMCDCIKNCFKPGDGFVEQFLNDILYNKEQLSE